MKCFGFPLDGQRSALQLWQLLIFGSLMTLATIVLHCFSLIEGCERLKNNQVNSTTANLLNIGIEHLNYTCILIGVQLSFFIICLNGAWRELWQSVLEIEHHLNLKKSFYHRCRKIVLIGYCLLLLVILSYCKQVCGSKIASF